MKILRILRKVSRYSGALLLFALGSIGVGVAAANPMPLLAPYLPLHVENILWTGSWIHLEASAIQNVFNIFYASALYLCGTLSIAILLLCGAFILLVQDPRSAIKTLGRGFKASPKAVLYSPITLYRNALIWRDWLLAKIDYLQTESAKWRRTFQVMKSPYSLLRMMGFSPQMAVSFLIAGSAVGTGVAVNETVFSERSFSRGDSGVYSAPRDVPTTYVEGTNTLRIDLGATPVREITIENVSVGTVFTGSALPSGEANVVQVSGNAAASGFNATRLEVGHLIFENSRCKKLTLTDIQAHTLIVIGNASDGQSLAPSPGTSRMRAIGGGHQQADAMVTSGGTYDRIWIQAPNSGINGKIGTLKLSNLYTKGGDCVLSKMNVGTMEILLNEVGMGNGFSTKEFTISTSVTAANMIISDNVEVTIAEPVTS